jgi:hypothetical protein
MSHDSSRRRGFACAPASWRQNICAVWITGGPGSGETLARVRYHGITRERFRQHRLRWSATILIRHLFGHNGWQAGRVGHLEIARSDSGD